MPVFTTEQEVNLNDEIEGAIRVEVEGIVSRLKRRVIEVVEEAVEEAVEEVEDVWDAETECTCEDGARDNDTVATDHQVSIASLKRVRNLIDWGEGINEKAGIVCFLNDVIAALSGDC